MAWRAFGRTIGRWHSLFAQHSVAGKFTCDLVIKKHQGIYGEFHRNVLCLRDFKSGFQGRHDDLPAWGKSQREMDLMLYRLRRVVRILESASDVSHFATFCLKPASKRNILMWFLEKDSRRVNNSIIPSSLNRPTSTVHVTPRNIPSQLNDSAKEKRANKKTKHHRTIRRRRDVVHTISNRSNWCLWRRRLCRRGGQRSSL